MLGLDASPGIRSVRGSRVARELIIFATLVVVADILLYIAIPYALAALEALLISGFLPGIILVAHATGQRPSTIDGGERLLYGLGMGYALIVLTVMLISYLPGGVTRIQLLAAAHALLALLAIVVALSGQAPLTNLTGALRTMWARGWNRALSHPWKAAAVGVLLLAALILRFVHLGYSEFQGDEAVVALRAVDVIQGYENALLTHLKGPAEILFPTLELSLAGRLTEFTGRMPFALANVLGLLAFALLATRLLGFAAGWFSAMLLVVDGYLLAFGRILQYQSLVFLMLCLSVLLLHRLLTRRESMARDFGLIAVFVAVGLLAHYDAVFVALPALYVIWRLVRESQDMASVRRALRWPMLLGALILSVFVVPFALNPFLVDSLRYVFGYRMGGGASLAVLNETWQRTALYDSSYAVMLVIGLAAIAEANALWRTLKSRRSVVVVGVAWLGLTGIYLLSEPAPGSDFGLLKLGITLALALPIASPSTPVAERMIWWWLAGPVIVLLFYTQIPGTHVYSIAVPLALIAGYGARRLHLLLKAWRWAAPVRFGVGAVAAASLVVTFVYVGTLFVRHSPEALRTWYSSRPVGYWMPFDDPAEWAIFGFPLRNGWKTAGVLFAAGDSQGAYDTNHRPAVAEWYLRGETPCARDDPQTYLLAQKVEPVYADETEDLRRHLAEKHGLRATVIVNGEPKMGIFQVSQADGEVQELHDADFAPLFDRELSGVFEPRSGPVGSKTASEPVKFWFGPDIELTGFDLAQKAFKPGEEVDVTLDRRADQRLVEDYQVSVQVVDLTDSHKAGQRDGEPVCNQLPTSAWIPGDLIADRYRFSLAPDAKPGLYTLLVVMYGKDGALLDVTGGTGNPVGPGAPLTSVNLTP